MNQSICILMAVGVVLIADGASAATPPPRTILCAGATTLKNGSVITLGQPLAGTVRAADHSVTLSLGFVPTLRTQLPVTNQWAITPSVVMENGRFRFGFLAAPGQSWVVEGPTNLFEWFPVWTGTATDPWVVFEDTTALFYPHRFYRVWLP